MSLTETWSEVNEIEAGYDDESWILDLYILK